MSVFNNSSLFREEDEVDLTNLIDLMVVICAVLMVTLPAYSALATQLTKQSCSAQSAPTDPPVVMRFSDNEALTWNDDKVSWDQAVRRVQALKDSEKNTSVLIIGDERASYGFSVRLRAMIASQGVEVNELNEYRKEKKQCPAK